MVVGGQRRRERIAADGMHGGMYGPLARWHEADMNVRWGALTNRKPMWGGSCTRSLVDGRFGSGVAGWLLLCFLRPSATPTKYSRAPAVASHRPWYRLSSHLRRRADAVLQPFSTKQLSPPTNSAQLLLCLLTALPTIPPRLYFIQRQPQLKQQRSYPCIFILSIIYTCLSFVPALNFEIRS